MKVTVHRKAHFNAAHRLYKKGCSDADNFALFGKCSNPYYHGHNYELIVSVTGPIDPATGFVIDMKVLKQIIRNEVEAKLDHKNLNEEVAAFENLIPTVENIAVVIWKDLRPHISTELDLSITLYETPRNFATYSGE